MTGELHQEVPDFHDVSMPRACVACGGDIHARFGGGKGCGVCLACHAVARLAVAATREGVRVIHAPSGAA